MTEIFDNIRGIYDFRPPCEELQPFIEFFSESPWMTMQVYLGGQVPRESS